MASQKKSRVSQAGLTGILILIVGFFLGMMVFILGNVYKENKPVKNVKKEETVQSAQEEVTEAELKARLCVLKSVDNQKRIIVLYDTVDECTVKLSYTGGTDIRDQYLQIIAASQLIVGEMVEAVYEESDQTLKTLIKSPNTWEYTGVTGFNPDRKNKQVTLYGEKYRYTGKVYVRDKDGETALLSINNDDMLTVRGYDKMIYSIEVTKGHGSLILKNCESFEGGTIIVNGDEYNDFSSDMVFTQREGKVDIQLIKNGVVKRTTVKVIRNEEVQVDVSVFAPNPPEEGLVTFSIQPFGAKLFVDKQLTSYSDSVELTYGKHTIEVIMDGYESYSGNYELNSPTDIVQIRLASAVSNKDEDKNEKENSQGSSENGNVVQTPSYSLPTNNGNSNSSSSESKDEKENESGSEEAAANTDPDHTITISSPSGVSVYLDGVFKGIAPVTTVKPLGVTYVTLLKEGCEQITHTIDVEDDKENKTYRFPQLKTNRE